ncbi:2-dehydro-3-deoxy-6-phosphogalactonate aldolase [Propionivibrio soli]|uniref:2-dehydro-3-deoxy-6-phosphogalactonate aldolase n=1 Tax=Propionivibrio soli TaxID=2976531 RepID=UPI0021E71CEE|nr:2-dehydro-3-deoxy-6-phosphogalactonate aldolase [Propionivibrio soli]
MADLNELTNRFSAALRQLPLVAILRGIKPSEAQGVGRVLYEKGFRLIEVPLNSPDPFDSIAAIRRSLPDDALVGAGTVLSVDNVTALRQCGGEVVVMPHSDGGVIRAAKDAGLLCVPGVVTPTEAFSALAAGADALKLFPAELVSPQILNAIRVVLPATTRLLPVGGIAPNNMKPFVDAGAAGFGLGSALYSPGMNIDEVARRAGDFVSAWREIAPASA